MSSSYHARRADATAYVKQTPSVPIAVGATVAVIVVLLGLLTGKWLDDICIAKKLIPKFSSAIFFVWRMRRRKNQAGTARSTTLFGSSETLPADLESNVPSVEKPRAVLRPSVPSKDSGVRWAPQIRTVGGQPVATLDKNPSIHSLASTHKADINDQLTPDDQEPLQHAETLSPPSSMVTTRDSVVKQTPGLYNTPASCPLKNLPPTPSPTTNSSTIRDPQTHPIFTEAPAPGSSCEAPSPVLNTQTAASQDSAETSVPSNLHISLPPMPSAPLLTTEFPLTPAATESDQPSPNGTIQIVMPSLSPRSSSFRAAKSVWSTTTMASSIDPSMLDSSDADLPPPLPATRLMVVIDTFTPNLEDELAIYLGDEVRLLDEYPDGWCLVQCLSRANAPKGVVPRTHIRDKNVQQS